MSGIIQSYGLRWEESYVYWGKGQQAGSLLGVPARARSSPAIDFRGQIGIYVLYSNHNPIYIGQTGSGQQKLLRRLKKHTRDTLAGRWDKFSWFGLRSVLANGNLSAETMRATASVAKALDHIEAVLIAATEPALNKQGGRFKGGVKYLQVRDKRLGLTDTEILHKLWEHSQLKT